MTDFDWTMDACLKAARASFDESPSFLFSLLQKLRPYICPFERFLGYVKPDARVADIGCGAGLTLNILDHWRQLGSGVGVDVSEKAIDLAKKSRGGKGGRLEFRVTETIDAWPQEEFDAVIVIDVLHHIPRENQADFLKAVAALVGPDGTLIYKDMSSRPLFYNLMNRLHDLVLARQWINYMHKDDALAVIKDHGLQVVDEFTSARFWYHHYGIVAVRPASD